MQHEFSCVPLMAVEGGEVWKKEPNNTLKP